MDTECQELGGLIVVELPLHQNRISTEIDVPLLCDQPTHNRGHLGMDDRFATGNTDDRGATFLCCSPTLFWREPFVQHMIRILDLSATGTGQIAAEQGF